MEISVRDFYHCSVHIPHFLSAKYEQRLGNMPCVFRASSSDHVAYLSWNGGVSSTVGIDGVSDTLEIDSIYAQTLGFRHGELVGVELVENVPLAHSVIVEPCTFSDWEIIESNAGVIEEMMLSQVSVVSINQKIVFYITPFLFIILQVVETDPKQPSSGCLFLQSNVEIHIAPKPRPKFQKESTNILRQIGKCYEAMINDDLKEFELGISRDGDIVEGEIVKVTRMSQIEMGKLGLQKLFLRTKFIENKEANSDLVFLSHNVYQKVFELKQRSKIFVSAVEKHEGLFDAEIFISLQPIQSMLQSDDFIVRDFKLLVKSGSMPLTCGMIIRFGCDLFQVSLFETSNKPLDFVIVSESDLPRISIMINDTKLILSDVFDDKQYMKAGFEDLIAEIVANVDSVFHSFSAYNFQIANLFLFGIRGSGKTNLLKCVENETKVYCEFVDCNELCKKFTSVDLFHSQLLKIFETIAYNAPSLLIIDDVNLLIDHVSNHPKLLETLWSKLLLNQQNLKFCTLMSVESVEKLNKSLLKSLPILNIFEIPPTTAKSRMSILRHHLSHDHLCDLEYISSRTDGFLPEDLRKLVSKAKQYAFSHNNSLGNSSFDEVLKAFTPVSLSISHIEKPTITLAQVGGMFEPKKRLIEAVDWPMRFREVFDSFGFPVKSGILLYGPPGCGKSFIVPALANECNLNYLSVNGPELMDKYIGASEELVRNLFKRARMAVPCLLFIDEFDSIGRIRGSESTGPTDRIVNQLLTELDGADVLENVIVVAATGRPDLLDAALVRPGRLDQRIFVGFPTIEERLDILKVLGKEVQDVEDWEWLAGETEGWTCADLRALFSNAQVALAEESLKQLEINKDMVSDESNIVHVNAPQMDRKSLVEIEERIMKKFLLNKKEVKERKKRVNRRHLEIGFDRMLPSFTQQQRLEYEAYFRAFAEGKLGELGTKVTLSY